MSTFVFSSQHKDAEYCALVVGVIDSYWGRCNANVQRHLSNKLEYRFLCCISVHYQSRMTSNGIANTPSRFHSADRQGKMGEDNWRTVWLMAYGCIFAL
jgi:hypothetical protein